MRLKKPMIHPQCPRHHPVYDDDDVSAAEFQANFGRIQVSITRLADMDSAALAIKVSLLD